MPLPSPQFNNQIDPLLPEQGTYALKAPLYQYDEYQTYDLVDIKAISPLVLNQLKASMPLMWGSGYGEYLALFDRFTPQHYKWCHQYADKIHNFLSEYSGTCFYNSPHSALSNSNLNILKAPYDSSVNWGQETTLSLNNFLVSTNAPAFTPLPTRLTVNVGALSSSDVLTISWLCNDDSFNDDVIVKRLGYVPNCFSKRFKMIKRLGNSNQVERIDLTGILPCSMVVDSMSTSNVTAIETAIKQTHKYLLYDTMDTLLQKCRDYFLLAFPNLKKVVKSYSITRPDADLLFYLGAKQVTATLGMYNHVSIGPTRRSYEVASLYGYGELHGRQEDPRNLVYTRDCLPGEFITEEPGSTAFTTNQFGNFMQATKNNRVHYIVKDLIDVPAWFTFHAIIHANNNYWADSTIASNDISTGYKFFNTSLTIIDCSLLPLPKFTESHYDDYRPTTPLPPNRRWPILKKNDNVVGKLVRQINYDANFFNKPWNNDYRNRDYISAYSTDYNMFREITNSFEFSMLVRRCPPYITQFFIEAWGEYPAGTSGNSRVMTGAWRAWVFSSHLNAQNLLDYKIYKYASGIIDTNTAFFGFMAADIYEVVQDFDFYNSAADVPQLPLATESQFIDYIDKQILYK